jgi:hypothetical protein
MRSSLITAAVLLMFCLSAYAEKIGICPPAPPISSSVPSAIPSKPGAASQTVNGMERKVILQAVISEKGYVCSLQIAYAFSREGAKRAIDAVKTWKFEPAKKQGVAVPVVILVEVHFRETPDGKLVPIEQSAHPKKTDGKVDPPKDSQ